MVDIDTSFLDSSWTLSSEEVEFKKKKKQKSVPSLHPASRNVLERQELLHTVEVLKLEITQKSLLAENLRVEHASHVEELQERLSDAQHQCQLLRTQLDHVSRTSDSETEQLRRRISFLTSSLAEAERNWQRVEGQLSELRDTTVISPALLNERLKHHSLEDLSPKELLQVRVFDAVKPIEAERDSLQKEVDELSEKLYQKEDELQQEREARKVQQAHQLRLEMLCKELQDKLEEQVMSAISRHKQEDFCVSNYGQLEKEKDALQVEVEQIRQQLTTTERHLAASVADCGQVTSELADTHQELELLRQDKTYLSQRVDDLRRSQHHDVNHHDHLERKLREAQVVADQLRQDLLSTREKCRTEFEERFSRELEQVKAQTAGEVERLRQQSRDVSERESRFLQEALEIARVERDRASAELRDVQDSLKETLVKLHELQCTADGRVAEAEHELQLKTFELERVQLLHCEDGQQLKQLNLEVEKMSKKHQLVASELLSVQLEYERRLMALEVENKTLAQRLSSYEELEKELQGLFDQTMDGVSEETVPDGSIAVTPGHLAVTRHWKRRMAVARQLLSAENRSASLLKSLNEEKTRSEQLQDELSTANKLLNQTQQPFAVLMESLKERDSQLAQRDRQLQEKEKELNYFRQEIETMYEEREKLKQQHSQMASDLEHLLQQQQEFTDVKATVEHLIQQRISQRHVVEQQMSQKCMHPKRNPTEPITTRSAIPVREQPVPTIFTKSSKHHQHH